MSPPKLKKRSSILKKNPIPSESPESTTTASIRPRRGILFSEKNTVKEFLPCDEKTTIWGNSYETSIAKSEGSSNGSQSSGKLSLDFSSSNDTVTSLPTVINEAEKENLPIPKVPENDESRRSSSSYSESSSLVNMTVDINPDERRRIKKYGSDNLNVTNMILESSLAANSEKTSTPKKTDSQSEMPKIFRGMRETLLSKKVLETEKAAVLFTSSDDPSLQLDQEEKKILKAKRRTTHQSVDMEQSVTDNLMSIAKPPGHNLGKTSSTASVSERFKEPPRIFRNLPSEVSANSAMCIDSPPIKVANLQNQKEIVEEFMEFMVTETPTKNLCHQMCTSRKHTITPLQGHPGKIVFSSSKSNWFNRPISMDPSPPKVSRRSSDILGSLGLKLDSSITTRKTGSMNLSIEGKAPEAAPQRETQCNETKMDESAELQVDFSINARETVYEDVAEDNKAASSSNSRKTVYEESIVVEELAAEPSSSTMSCVRKTLFGGSIESVAQTEKSPSDSNNVGFLGPRALMKRKLADVSMKNSVVDETIYNNDISLTCNFEQVMNRKSNSIYINCTNFNDTEMLETTCELAAKAAHLLKNPMATTASTSNLFTNDSNINDSMIADSPIHSPIKGKTESPPILDVAGRNTIYDLKMSTSINAEGSGHSPIEGKTESPPILDVAGRNTIYDLKMSTSINAERSGHSPIERKTESSPFLDVADTKTIYDTKMSTSINADGSGHSPIERKTESSPILDVAGRKTIYDTKMSTSIIADSPVHSPIEQKKESSPILDVAGRKTIYDTKMSTSIIADSPVHSPIKGKTGSSPILDVAGRKTIYDTKMSTSINADDSGHSPIERKKESPFLDVAGRKTIYDTKMSTSINAEGSGHSLIERKKESSPFLDVAGRKTIYDTKMSTSINTDVSVETETKVLSPIAKVLSPIEQNTKYKDSIQGDRLEPTLLSKIDIDISGIEPNIEAAGKQVYHESMSSMKESFNLGKKIPRKTTHEAKMDISISESVDQNSSGPPPKVFTKPIRRTMYSNETMNETNQTQEKSAFAVYEDSTAGRESEILHNSNASRDVLMEETYNDIDFSIARRATFNQTSPDFEWPSLTIIPPPQQFKSPIIPVLPPHKSPSLRESVIRRSAIKIEQDRRRTVYDQSPMELDEPSEPTANETFVMKKNDTLRLLNITDADFESLIDDESNPCMIESNNGSQQMQMSCNATTYQQAVHDFFNVTIQSSCLDMSVDSPGGRNFKERCFNTPTDLSIKLGKLGLHREDMHKRKPRLEIDEFLDNLKIKPVTMKRLPDLHDFQRMCKESREIVEKSLVEARAESKKKYAKEFSFEKHLERINAEVKKDIERQEREGLITIAPVFPERRDFDFLLLNKFETDQELSTFWEVDLTFAWMKQYKFVHKKMPQFKINITIQVPWESLNDSTIPIYFANVLMYSSPAYRGILSSKLKIQINEFKRALGTDTFLSKCPSMEYLLNFLDFYHRQVSKTVALVDNFFKVLDHNNAILDKHQKNSTVIHKRHFTTDGEDIVDVKIAVDHIKETTIDDVSITGLTCYDYKLRPRRDIAEMKGLMLIEIVLFDVEKFLSNNAERIKVEKA